MFDETPDYGRAIQWQAEQIENGRNLGRPESGRGAGMSALLDKMQAKLVRLETEMAATFEDDPRSGHMGTPYVDNSKGRQMRRVCDRIEERRQSLNRQIKEQREKIEHQKSREAYRATQQTKQSAKFIEKNPISPVLFRLQEMGKVKQWPRNPQLFFVVGLQKVALITVGEKVGVCKKYPAKTKAEFELCQQLIAEAAA